MALVSKVGGAAGPLYGTAFLRASSALANKDEVSAADAAEALEAALGGVQQRGKAEPGDKTMVDALTPAVEAAKAAADADGTRGRRPPGRGRRRQGGRRGDGPAHGQEGAGQLPGRPGPGASGPRGHLHVPAPGRGGPHRGGGGLMVGLVLDLAQPGGRRRDGGARARHGRGGGRDGGRRGRL